MKIKFALVSALIALIGADCIRLQAQPPSIQFTQVPPLGTGQLFEGQVTGVSPTNYGVAFFIQVYGAWFTKPTYAVPVWTLNADGTFAVNLDTGGADAYAQKISAYVVLLSYSNSIPLVGGETEIPPEIASNSVASITVDRPLPTTNFSGYTWEIKETGNGGWGPGPNSFSAQNVMVDAQGRMHLSVNYTNSEWKCAEVDTLESLGYGTYRFELDSDPLAVSTNMVVGLFTYDYSDSPEYREIDIEFSHSLVAGDPTNCQYVIQPFQVPGNRTNFSAPGTGMGSSTHTFTWYPGGVYFESYTNHVEDQRSFYIQSSPDMVHWTDIALRNVASNSTAIIAIPGPQQKAQFFRAVMAPFAGTPAPFQTATLTNDIPTLGQQQVHMNVWLFDGIQAGPDTTQTYEVVIDKFEFIPLASIQPQLEIADVGANQTTVLLKYRLAPLSSD